jgi:phosphohistidine phosphatase
VRKRLAILRHAKSDWGDAGLSDFERPLNERGRAAAELIRQAIDQRGLTFDTVLSSPAARTRETLELIGLADRAQWDEDIYLASTKTLLAIVGALPDETESALIVGHNPGLHEIALDLSQPDSAGLRKRILAKYPTGALAMLELEVDSWSEVAPGCGTIRQLLLPREL